MDAFVAVSAAMVGLAVGSFLNVVIHRVPRHESVVSPRSRCPECGTEISPRDNVPIVSWLVLRGRCRHCGAAIALRYPLVEGANAVLWLALGLRFGADPALPAFLVFASVLLAISLIDLEHYIVPNRILIVGLPASVLLLAGAAAVDGEWLSLRRAVLGGLGAFSAMLVVHLIQPRGMGMGDVKLAALLGLHLGWLSAGMVAVGMFFGFFLGAFVGLGLIVTGIRSRKDAVPFAPFLAAGSLLAVFVGQRFLDLYLG